MSVATVDMRDMSEDELLDLYRSGDTAALAEAKRRDQAAKAARDREQIRAEWYDAAYEQYLAADAECRGNLISREGIAAGVNEAFSLWSGRTDVAERYASEELNDFWRVSPRVTITRYMEQRAAAMRAAREDTSTREVERGNRVDADRRPEVDGNGTGSVRPVDGTRADEPVRPDRGARETVDGPTTWICSARRISDQR